MYFYMFIVCGNTRTSRINTHVFFDFRYPEIGMTDAVPEATTMDAPPATCAGNVVCSSFLRVAANDQVLLKGSVYVLYLMLVVTRVTRVD